MSNRDRKTTVKERQNPTHPLQPLNFNVQWAFSTEHNAIDLYWDDPALLPNNTGFDLLGVNIYRSFDSEWGPFTRLNTNPLGVTYYRDETKIEDVVDEDVSARFVAQDDETGRWIFKVSNFPIVRPEDPQTISFSTQDVEVKIDGVVVPIHEVIGETGEVTLRSGLDYDVVTNSVLQPVLPTPDSVVTVSYSYNTNLIEHDLYKRTFYRITSVGYDKWDGLLKETPLKWTEARHIHQMENLDYIWREAIRRNRWILDQGGERVKLFLHKYRGIKCSCYRHHDDPHPVNDCLVCFGTGIRGGYEGPFEILLAPPDAERVIRQTERGRVEEQTYDVWTGPRPLISQRDFVVKMNGDRYSIGPVRMPTNRGNVLQQHFNVNLLAKNDIRNRVPVTGTEALAFPETRTMDWDDDPAEVRYPQITDKAQEFCSEPPPDGIEERGRTPVWENIQY